MSDSEDLMQDRDRIEAYRQTKQRALDLGYPSVNHALDALEEARRSSLFESIEALQNKILDGRI